MHKQYNKQYTKGKEAWINYHSLEIADLSKRQANGA